MGKIKNFKLKNKGEQIAYVIFYLAILLGLIMGFIYVFTVLDFKPATLEDFKPLYKQKQLLESDFSSVWNMDNVEINLLSDSKEIILCSTECDLLLEFDEQFKIISTKEIDNHISIGFGIFLSFAMGLAFMVALMMVFLGIIGIIYLVSQKFTKKVIKKTENSNTKGSESKG